MHQYIKFILFWNDTLHVSDGLSDHRQSVQDCTYSNRHLSNRYCSLLSPDDGRRDSPKHVECHSQINKFDTLVHLHSFTIGISFFTTPAIQTGCAGHPPSASTGAGVLSLQQNGRDVKTSHLYLASRLAL